MHYNLYNNLLRRSKCYFPINRFRNAVRKFSDKGDQNPVEITFIDAEGVRSVLKVHVGQTILEVAHNNDIELEGACGGELACSTCHCIFEENVFSKLPEISEEEEDMLDLAWGLTNTSRLGCQIKITNDLDGAVVTIPQESNDMS